jgi:hypothetical protein
LNAPHRSRRTAGPCLVALCVAVVLAPAPARATRYAGEFLRVGVGARALGMGAAFAGLSDDGTAAYWNPAGLATLGTHEITAMHASQFGGVVDYDWLSYTFPMGAEGKARQGLAVSLIRLGVDGIINTKNLQFIDVNGNGKFDYPEDRLIVDENRYVFDNDNDAALLFSYAREVSRTISLGGNLKVLHQWLGDSLRSNGFGLDIAALYVGKSGWSAGAKLSDATTTRILWNTGVEEFIAPSLRLGGAKTFSFHDRRHILTPALDIEVGFSDEVLSSQANIGSVTFNFHEGLEYWYQRVVALRAGFDSRNFTAGAGLRYKKFGLDYAYLDHQDLDASHRVSALFAF